MTGYYDIILGLIPVSFVGLTALLLIAGMSLTVSIPLASLVTLGVIGHAMFINAPRDPPTTDETKTTTNTESNTGLSAD